MDEVDNNKNEYRFLELSVLLALFILMYLVFLFVNVYAFLRGKTLEQTLSFLDDKNKNTQLDNYSINTEKSHYTLESFTIENDDLIKNKNKQKA